MNHSSGLRGVQAWPTMFFLRTWDRFAVHQQSILDLLYSLKESQTESLASGVAEGAKSSFGIYEGDFDLFQRDHASLQELVRFIRSTLATAVCIANQEGKPEDIEIRFPDSWYHITNQYGFHDAHWHHGCSWCGIFYLRLGSSEQSSRKGAPNGGSRFYNPLICGGGYRDFGNKYLTSSIDAPIEEGVLLLFPSFLMHSGLPYSGSEDRVVIAFNAQAFCHNTPQIR
ncbi:MAG: 2OG-Fe(II) oxygenase family protein [Pirellula sp.]|nr:2OG-Fe(II) oxygenase family protein [Pirellula sp.]